MCGTPTTLPVSTNSRLLQRSAKLATGLWFPGCQDPIQIMNWPPLACYTPKKAIAAAVQTYSVWWFNHTTVSIHSSPPHPSSSVACGSPRMGVLIRHVIFRLLEGVHFYEQGYKLLRVHVLLKIDFRVAVLKGERTIWMSI